MMSNNTNSPFEKEPAEGPRDIIDRMLQRADDADNNRGNHLAIYGFVSRSG